MGKDYLAMVQEGLVMFMCAMVGMYFMFATYYSVKHEIIKDEPTALDMYHNAFDDEN